MNDRAFDNLTRRLGSATSRRAMLKGLMAGVVGLAAAGRASGASASVSEQCGAGYQQCMDYAEQLHLNCLTQKTCNGRESPAECLSWKLVCQANYTAMAGICRSRYHCQCPSETTRCSSLFGSPSCCEADEYCQGNLFGFAQCVPRCDPCTVWDSATASCQPKECGTCQACDPASGQCVPAGDGSACGSGLSCCQGQCVSSACQGNQVFNDATCQCECAPVSCPPGQTQDPSTCQCACPPTTCPPGQTQDPTTCQCSCPVGTTTCGPFCCGPDKNCCPDAVSGMSCRDPDPNCAGCSFTCGDICCPNGQYCCRAADYSYHCVTSSGATC